MNRLRVRVRVRDRKTLTLTLTLTLTNFGRQLAQDRAATPLLAVGGTAAAHGGGSISFRRRAERSARELNGSAATCPFSQAVEKEYIFVTSVCLQKALYELARCTGCVPQCCNEPPSSSAES